MGGKCKVSVIKRILNYRINVYYKKIIRHFGAETDYLFTYISIIMQEIASQYRARPENELNLYCKILLYRTFCTLN